MASSALVLDKPSKKTISEMSLLFGINQKSLQSLFESYLIYIFLQWLEKDTNEKQVFQLPYVGEFVFNPEKKEIEEFKPSVSFEKLLKDKSKDNCIVKELTNKIVELLDKEKLKLEESTTSKKSKGENTDE